MSIFIIFFFFFSSRRRHTRFSRDWSSDVCSSDLIDSGGSYRPFGGMLMTARSTKKVAKNSTKNSTKTVHEHTRGNRPITQPINFELNRFAVVVREHRFRSDFPLKKFACAALRMRLQAVCERRGAGAVPASSPREMSHERITQADGSGHGHSWPRV